VAVAVHHRAGERVLAASTESEPAAVLDGVAAVEAVATEGSHPVAAGSGPGVAGEETALVLLTSGSTGTPGSVPHTHAGLAYKVDQLLEVHGLGPDDVVLMPAPLAHVSGLLHGVLVPGTAGMKAVLMDRWSPEDALALIEREQVTYMVGPPTFFLGLMDAPGFAPERVASLRVLSVGGAGVSVGFVERARDRLGCVVKRSYGSTEAPTVTTSRHDDDPARMASTDGRAFGATQLRVDGHGQLLVRGPEVSPAHVDRQGWYATGDLARSRGSSRPTTR
jgi:cyclohexanecarboxylate-CoA ligase